MLRTAYCCRLTLNNMDRICVFPKDVMRITGLGDRYAQKLLQDIRYQLNKKKHQLITKQELADYLGIDSSLIRLR